MCQIRDLINNFECLLFDKVIDKDTNITEGMQNHSLEMQLCKSMNLKLFFKSQLPISNLFNLQLPLAI